MKLLNPYHWIINSRNTFYNKGWLTQTNVSVPVISVGNLTTGGTGKTPFVLELISILKDKSILVVSKSYKTQLKNPAEITPDNLNQTFIYGDEPCLIKKSKPDIFVWSGPNKTQTVKKALDYYSRKDIKIDVIIVDDAFSHRSLKRDLDIVLVDVSRPMSHYQLLPCGHLRENIYAILRSNLVVLTKTNNANLDTFNYFKSFLNKHKHPAIESQAISDVSGIVKKLFLFTAIGNPEQLVTNLTLKGFEILKHLSFSDHHHFSHSEQQEILNDWRSNYSDAILCSTAKDKVKISNEELYKNTHEISLILELSDTDRKLLNEKVSQIF